MRIAEQVMAVRLDLQPEAIAELVALSRYREQIATVLAAVSVLSPQVGVTGLARNVARRLKIEDHRELVTMFVTLMNFYQTKTQLKITTEAMAEAVTGTLKESQTVTDGKLMAWESVKDIVVSAVDHLDHNHSLVQSYKAYRVATSRQYEMVDMHIFADVRPASNDHGDSITQSVITHESCVSKPKDVFQDSTVTMADDTQQKRELEAKFIRLRDKWQSETSHISATSKRVLHSAYQSIIGMGQPAIPLILNELERNVDSWFWALAAIAEDDPATPESMGNGELLAAAWIAWGKQKGYVW